MGLIVAVYNFACFPWHLWTYVIIRCIRYTSLQLPGNYLMLSGNGSRPGGCSVSDSCFVLPGTAGTARTAWGDRRRRRAALGGLSLTEPRKRGCFSELAPAWKDQQEQRTSTIAASGSKSRSSTGPRHGANTDWEAVKGYPTIHKSAQSVNFGFDILSHTQITSTWMIPEVGSWDRISTYTYQDLGPRW